MKISQLDEFESRIALIMCPIETALPHTFFNIMVHLQIHMVEETKLPEQVH